MASLRYWQRGVLVGVGVVALGVLAAVAAGSLRQVGQAVTTSTGHCGPPPCAGPNGFEVDVSQLAQDANHVTMDVSFKNHTQPSPFEAVSYRHTSPADFQLRLADGRRTAPVFDSTCPDWPEIDVQRGAGMGPKPLCFPRSNLSLRGAALVWSPDLGFLFNSIEIPLD